jgi:hypothetical protein
LAGVLILLETRLINRLIRAAARLRITADDAGRAFLDDLIASGEVLRR